MCSTKRGVLLSGEVFYEAGSNVLSCQIILHLVNEADGQVEAVLLPVLQLGRPRRDQGLAGNVNEKCQALAVDVAKLHVLKDL